MRGSPLFPHSGCRCPPRPRPQTGSLRRGWSCSGRIGLVNALVPRCRSWPTDHRLDLERDLLDVVAVDEGAEGEPAVHDHRVTDLQRGLAVLAELPPGVDGVPLGLLVGPLVGLAAEPPRRAADPEVGHHRSPAWRSLTGPPTYPRRFTKCLVHRVRLLLWSCLDGRPCRDGRRRHWASAPTFQAAACRACGEGAPGPRCGRLEVRPASAARLPARCGRSGTRRARPRPVARTSSSETGSRPRAAVGPLRPRGAAR